MYDNQGNAIVSNIDKVQKKINEDKDGAIKKAQESYQKVFSSLTDKKEYTAPSDVGDGINPITTELPSEIEMYNKLLAKQSQWTDGESKRFEETKKNLTDMNNAVMLIQKNGGDISNMKMFDFDKREMVDAKAHIDEVNKASQEANKNINSIDGSEKLSAISNALNELKSTSDLSADSVAKLKGILPDLDLSNMSAEQRTQALSQAQKDLQSSLDATGNSAKSTADQIKEMASTFTSSSNQINTLQKALQEFQKNKGVIDESTMEAIFSSGNTQLISLLGDQNTFLEKGNALLGQMNTERDEEKAKIIQTAMAEQDATNTKSDAYSRDVANKTGAENAKDNVVTQILNDFANKTGQNVNTLAQHYNVDLQNKTSAENGKGGVVGQILNDMARATGQNVDVLARQYGVDSTNFANAQNSKLQSFNQFVSAMGVSAQQVTNMMTTAMNIPDVSKGVEGIADPFKAYQADKQFSDLGKKYEDYKNQVQSQMNAVTSGIKPVNANVSSSYNPISASVSPVSVGNVSGAGSGSGGKGGSGGSKATEKQVADLESLVDRYYRLKNVIDRLTSTISGYESAMKNAHGSQYVDLINKEIDAYKQKQQAIKNNISEMEKERWSLREQLAGAGFDFDSDWNINGNYASRLEQLRNQANSLSGDAKENAIKHVKDLSEATKKYAQLCFTDIPKADQEWQDLSNSIQDTYQKMVDAIADQEKKTFDVIKYYAEKTTKTKQDEIDKQIEQINKMYDNDDKQADMNSKQKQLAELKSEMDKFEFATDKAGQAKFKQLKDQYSQLEDEMNKTIRDNQKESTIDGMNKEKDALSSALEDYLKPENVNAIIENGLKTGMIDIMGQTVSLQQANAQMLKETEVGYTNVNNQIKTWKDNLSTIIAEYTQLSGISSSLGFNIDRSMTATINPKGLDVSALASNVTNGVNISIPLTIQGSVSTENLSAIQGMINTAVGKVKTELNNKLLLK